MIKDSQKQLLLLTNERNEKKFKCPSTYKSNITIENKGKLKKKKKKEDDDSWDCNGKSSKKKKNLVVAKVVAKVL